LRAGRGRGIRGEKKGCADRGSHPVEKKTHLELYGKRRGWLGEKAIRTENKQCRGLKKKREGEKEFRVERKTRLSLSVKGTRGSPLQEEVHNSCTIGKGAIRGKGVH